MVCCTDERDGKFPFDIQHKNIINYKAGSKRDFEKLEHDISKRLIAYLNNPTHHIFKFSEVPEPLKKYLHDFPQFDVPVDIRRGYIKTSRESFFRALQCVLSSLNAGEKAISTDSINLSKSSQYLQYWAKEGLPYLRLNFEAFQRGVEFIRIFIVDKEEMEQNGDYFKTIAKLHQAAGVQTRYVIYQELLTNPSYLREFAVFSDKFVDETIFDVRSNQVIENFIHWTRDVVSIFAERANMMINLGEKFEGIDTVRAASSISELKKFAEKCAKVKLVTF